MKAVGTLPEGYKEFYSIDLQKNKKIALFLNILALVIAAVLIVPMHFVVPITTLYDSNSGFNDSGYLTRLIAMLGSMVVYMVLHELVHGIAMRHCGTKKVKYGFTGLYAFAGSDDYYDKSAYIFIALAPIVFWGIVIAIITPFVSQSWFWVVYMIQVLNISGAAGDLYVTVKFSRFPKDVLIKDYGVGMTVYSKEDCKGKL